MSLVYRQKVADGSRAGKWFHDAITISREPHEVYQFCKDPENIPQFMGLIQSVSKAEPPHHYEWTVQVFSSNPNEKWMVEITEHIPDQRLQWVAYRNDHLVHQGQVEFKKAPKNQGTEVHIRSYYRFAGGNVSHLLSRVSKKNPSQLVRDDLHRLKALMEAGEIATVKGQPRGAQPDEKQAKESVTVPTGQTQPA